VAILSPNAAAFAGQSDESQHAEEQLPRAMHSKMTERPSIRVGLRDADIIGADNRALQAAVDYVAGLGGGTVEIGAGEFIMRDSLHLRSFVTGRGTPGKTTLRKAKAAVSALALDGDYGEEQITLANADGFNVGDGVHLGQRLGWFHTTVAHHGPARYVFARQTATPTMVAGKAQAATVFRS
jgi:hypothetical protein